MKDFIRENPLFSLCGLHCGLCSMHVGGHCPGCGGGNGNQPCAIARCSREHGNVEHCFACACFPCEKYDGCTEYDSFITHQNQLSDLDKARRIGVVAYQAELDEKMSMLRRLLAGFNDGRKKTLFCLAVNLLELPHLRAALARIDADTQAGAMTVKEKAAVAAMHLKATADELGVTLHLRKKPKEQKNRAFGKTEGQQ